MSEVTHTHTHTHTHTLEDSLLDVELEVMFTFGCGLAVVPIKLTGARAESGGY